jgi:RNA polymerase sigma-70 factor, ECF subfamily
MATDPQAESVRLMARLAQGDESALAGLYGLWAKPLLNFLNGMCRDRALAEDLVQEVFLRVWKAAPRYEPRARFSTWLFQIGRNHWLNVREKALRRPQEVSLDPHDEGSSAEPAARPVAGLDSGTRRPEQRTLDRELGERIAAAVARLPERLREVWVLGAAQGLPYQEVAEVLDVPVGTVKSRMFQAVRTLRAQASA